jgi:hypothetical protein
MLRATIALMLILNFGAEVSAQDVSRYAQEAVKTINELRTIPVQNFELGPTPPPARVPGLLRRLNQNLKDLIVAVLNDPRRDTLADVEMVYNELRSAGWGDIYRSRWNAYGEISNIDFRWVTDHDPPLLVVDTELWEPCGSDPYSTLYVFQKRGRNWDLVMTTDADYLPKAGDNPDSGMEYLVSSQDGDGKWFFGVASVFPDCRSNGLDGKREVRFKIIRPSASPDDPAVLLDRHVQVFDRFNVPFEISSNEDTFSISVGKERRLDGELGMSVFRFDVRGNQVSRVAPLAFRPDDFLDEWVRKDWSEVAPWTSAAKGADLESWHTKLKNLAFDSTEIEFVQPCPKQGQEEGSWLVGLWIDQQQNRNIPDERLFISIIQNMGAYFVDGIGKARPAGCPGNTRPAMTLPDTDLPIL